jgi:aldehyde dehydrogenase (NAD+)
MSVAHYFETMDYGSSYEADGEVRTWLKAHSDGFGHFIDGRFISSSSKKTFETSEPASGKVLALVAEGTESDIADAVKAARLAQPKWAKLGGHGRARHLYALARMVQRHARLFAVLESLDNGKPIRETRDIDIPLVVRHFYNHAGWAQVMDREFPDHEPLGVAGQIIPWNFPLLMLAWKVAPAMAFGNTVVLKPAEYTPLTALLFAELAAEAGLPKGVLNIVTGDGKTGAALVDAPVDKIAFTGSTEVGKLIRERTAGTGKVLTLELGGKSPFMVFDDADLDGAVEGVIDAIYFNQGQVCCAGSRLLLQEGISDIFLAKLQTRMTHLRVGDPLDKSIDVGAIIDPVQRMKIDALVNKAIEEGATLFQPDCELPKSGHFYRPTLLTNVFPSSTVAMTEIFGPVLVAMTFRTPEEAVALANNSRYGLAASVWSETLSRALDIAPKIKAGVVWVNATNLFDAGVGFGGYRESGFGREGGREGAASYLKPKASDKRKPRRVRPMVNRFVAADTRFMAPSIDRTAKLFIGGKQVRSDGNYSRAIISPKGKVLGDISEGNRKDIRNAVQAAREAEGWSKATPHLRAQILYYIAENLSARADEFAIRVATLTGGALSLGRSEVKQSIERLFTYAAYADKFEGSVHQPPLRGVALAVKECLGVIGLVCPNESPLLAFVSIVAPAIAMGNRVVVVPSEVNPLAATDFYQVIETSDVPAGVVNIVTGSSLALAKTLAEHDDVDSIWAFGSSELSEMVEKSSIGNLKRSFVDYGFEIDWSDAAVAEGPLWLNHAVDTKNIWIPYGE